MENNSTKHKNLFRRILPVTAGLALLALTPTAAFAHTDVFFGLNLGGLFTPVYAPPPVVAYSPPPVYYAPAPPVYYAPPPPVYYAPSRVYYGNYGWHHHGWHDRDDWHHGWHHDRDHDRDH